MNLWSISFETECIHRFLHSQKEKITWFDKSQLHNLCVTKLNRWLEQRLSGWMLADNGFEI